MQHLCNCSNNLDQLLFSTFTGRTVFYYSNNFFKSPSLLRCSGNLAMTKLPQSVNIFPVIRLCVHFPKVLSFYCVILKYIYILETNISWKVEKWKCWQQFSRDPSLSSMGQNRFAVYEFCRFRNNFFRSFSILPYKNRILLGVVW